MSTVTLPILSSIPVTACVNPGTAEVTLYLDIPASRPELWIKLKDLCPNQTNDIGCLKLTRVAYQREGLYRYLVSELRSNHESIPKADLISDMKALAFPKYITYESF